MQSDDRAVLEKVMVCMDKLRLSTSKAERDALLDLLRSDLSLPNAAQVKAQARREAIEEKGWLIELAAEGAPSMYLGRYGWSTPHFAIRYSRKEDAEAGYSLFARVPSPHVRFTEHVWMDAQPAARGEKEDEKPEAATHEVPGGVAGRDRAGDTPPPASLRPGLLRAAEMARVRASLFLGASGQFGQGHHAACTTLADALAAEAAKHSEKPEAVADSADSGNESSGIPNAPPPAPLDDAAVLADSLWISALERHDTRPAREVVAEIATFVAAKTLDDCYSSLISHAHSIAQTGPESQAHRRGMEVSALMLKQESRRLRQPPAPEPEPDVFVAFANASFLSDKYMSDDAREWFGPLVAELELIAADKRGLEARHYAASALAQIRARASGAEGGERR